MKVAQTIEDKEIARSIVYHKFSKLLRLWKGWLGWQAATHRRAHQVVLRGSRNSSLSWRWLTIEHQNNLIFLPPSGLCYSVVIEYFTLVQS
jgi:hypothetical protein